MLTKLEKKHRNGGVIAVIVFMILLFLFFFMVSFRIPDPIPEEVILVMEVPLAGSKTGGSSKSEPKAEEKPKEVEKPAEKNPAEKIQTQKQESVHVPTSDNTQKSKSKTVTKKKEKTAREKTLEKYSMKNTPGNGTNEGVKEGDGKKLGDGNVGNSIGHGTNYGRQVLKKPVLNHEVETDGKITISIIVKEDGTVESVKIVPNETNISNLSLQKKALSAVRKMKFEKKSGAGLQQVKPWVFVFKSQ